MSTQVGLKVAWGNCCIQPEAPDNEEFDENEDLGQLYRCLKSLIFATRQTSSQHSCNEDCFCFAGVLRSTAYAAVDQQLFACYTAGKG